MFLSLIELFRSTSMKFLYQCPSLRQTTAECRNVYGNSFENMIQWKGMLATALSERRAKPLF